MLAFFIFIFDLRLDCKRPPVTFQLVNPPIWFKISPISAMFAAKTIFSISAIVCLGYDNLGKLFTIRFDRSTKYL